MKVGESEEVAEARWREVLAIFLVIIAFGSGLALGRIHHGQTLVPVRESSPTTLPYWACAEIVDGRLAQEDMMGIIAKIVKDGPPDPDKQTVWHFRTRAERVCR